MGALTLAVWMSAASDAATTHYALAHGMREQNPIVRGLIGDHPSRIWIAKGAVTAGVLYAISKAPASQRRGLKIFTAALWGAVSVLNLVRINHR